MSEKLIQLYKKMSDLTQPKCTTACNAPQTCCSPEYCKMAIEFAEDAWNVELKPTGHPHLPLMGPNGCTAAPHYRPLCTLHVCEKIYMMDPKFNETYFTLRDELGEAQYEHDREGI